MTEFEVESMSEGSEAEDDSDLEVNLSKKMKCRKSMPCVNQNDYYYLHCILVARGICSW